jgi:hypothetical protein
MSERTDILSNPKHFPPLKASSRAGKIFKWLNTKYVVVLDTFYKWTT